jgi:hypothetical protein
MKLGTSVAVAVSIVCVSARATTIPARSVDPQFPALAKCIQKTSPGFPKDGSKPTTQQLRDCVDQTQPKARRAEAAEDDVLLYEPEEADAVKPRGIVDTTQVLGQQLYLNKKPWCEGTQVHDNFVWVGDIVPKANDVCSRLKNDIEKHGLKEDGSVGAVVNLITNGYGFGSGRFQNQLMINRHLTATYLLNFYPPARTGIEGVKQLAAGVYDLCNDAIIRITEKGNGCAVDVPYFRPSKAKTYHEVGAIGGTVRMFLGKDTNPVADLSLMFSNDD